MRLLATLFGQQQGQALRTSLLNNTSRAATTQSLARDTYAMLASYYDNNGLYDILRDASHASALSGEALRGLRNPAFRACEFYVAHIWPGVLPKALPIVPDDGVPNPTALVSAVEQVWSWSNWGHNKQVATRYQASLGDLFIKIVGDAERRQVYHELVEPWTVTDFATDRRGFVVLARLDVPQYDDVRRTWTTHTEVWSKADSTYRAWVTDGDAVPRSLADLGTPRDEAPLAAFGIDFVPLVWAPFRDVGAARGACCYWPAIDKIDELNRIVTRLHQTGFKHAKATWVTTRDMRDRDNRPLAKIDLGGQMASRASADAAAIAAGRNEYASDSAPIDLLSVADEQFIDLPGATDLKSLVPNLNYDALLNTANATLSEIESDLPEIRYYRLAELGAQLSGRAIDNLMRPAKARVLEARANGEGALARADMMACTIGKALGLPEFAGLGDFDSGALRHSFEERDVFALGGMEEAEEERTRAQAAQAYAAAKWPVAAVAKRLGLEDDEAAELLAMMTASADAGDEGDQSGGTVPDGER